jgi:hypothetical protein
MSEITITMPDQPAEQAAMIQRGATWAEALVIATPDDRKQASAGVARMKGALKDIADLFADSKKAASDAHKAICAAEKRLADPVKAAMELATRKMMAYDDEQERIRREQEAELRRKAEAEAEAERRRLAAIANRCKDEAKREAYQEAAAAVVPVAVAVAKADDKADGEIQSKRWKAELVSMDALIREAAAGYSAAISLLAFDQTAANRAAVAFKRDGVVPGVRFYADTVYQHRG